jgi:hypothetical protein
MYSFTGLTEEEVHMIGIALENHPAPMVKVAPLVSKLMTQFTEQKRQREANVVPMTVAEGG